MGILDKIFRRRRHRTRVNVRLRVTIGKNEEAYWTEDLTEGGMRMLIGKQLSLSQLTGDSREVPMAIQLEGDEEPVRLFGEPLWTVRTDDAQLSTGWTFARYEGDGEERLRVFMESVD